MAIRRSAKLVLCSLAAVVPAVAGAAVVFVPHVVVNETITDFGPVLRGAILTHTFRLTNRGRRPLHIQRVQETCVFKLNLGELPTVKPGGEVDLPLVLRTATLADGKVTQVVELTTNDPLNRTVRLLANAEVRAEFAVSNGYLLIPDSAGSQLEFQVLATGASGAIPLEARPTDERVRVVTTRFGNGSGPVGLRLLVSAPRGSSDRSDLGNVVIRTSSAVMPELRLPVRKQPAIR